MGERGKGRAKWRLRGWSMKNKRGGGFVFLTVGHRHPFRRGGGLERGRGAGVAGGGHERRGNLGKRWGGKGVGGQTMTKRVPKAMRCGR